MDEHAHCHEPTGHGKRRIWYKAPLALTCSSIVTLFVLSYFFPILVNFRISLLGYLRMMWLPIALGFVLGGLIDYYVPREYISKFLAAKSKRIIFYSAGLGFLASVCSHGVIALSIELHKKGASGPAVVSFLLASPWANMPITFLLIGFFGWKGLLIIGSALCVALVTGLVFQFLDRKGWIEKNKNFVPVPEGFSTIEDLKKRFSGYQFSLAQLGQDMKGIGRGIYALADMVLWWILIGIVLASLASAFVPETIFHRFLGPSVVGLIVTLAVATVLEICSEGTSPLAFEIYKQTGAFGNAFAFLMGGVVTDYTEVGLVWINLGRRTALWMLAVTIPQVFLIGWLFNMFF